VPLRSTPAALIRRHAHEMARLLRAGEVTSVELTEAHLAVAERQNRALHAWLTIDRERALHEARDADARIGAARGEGSAALARLHPLLGIPVGLKDLVSIRGGQATAGSRILDGYLAPFDAHITERLRDVGAVILGKTNMDEFAMGSSTEHSAFGPTSNPWALDRVPGGSSGGSSTAVAAFHVPLGIGTDTGGSIRQPAALTGIVGMKPTYGRVSRFGIVAFASSLDQIGPITKDVRDAAFLLGAIAGHDPLDSTSADVPVPDYLKALKRKDLKKLKVGVPVEFFAEGLDPEVERVVRAAIQQLQELGGEIKEIQLPRTDAAVATYYVVATAEASSNLARYDGVKFGLRAKETKDLLELYMKTRQEGFGPEVKRRIMLGTYVLSAGYYDAYYGKAQAVRTLIRQDFEEAFQNVDLIVTPVTPTPAFKFGAKADDPLQMYLSDIFTISANLAGVPAISLPCGFSQAGLPIGFQLIGRPFEEETLLRAAYAYEQSTQWRAKKPAVR